jgi:hypothetical protein
VDLTRWRHSPTTVPIGLAIKSAVLAGVELSDM